MQKLLGLGSYQTAWTMLHRYRTAMIRPGREVLTGRVEVDETFLGGEQPGVRGRGALGKTLVVVAVELREPRGYGRARMSVIGERRGGDAAQVPGQHGGARLHRRHRRLGRLLEGVPGLVRP